MLKFHAVEGFPLGGGQSGESVLEDFGSDPEFFGELVHAARPAEAADELGHSDELACDGIADLGLNRWRLATDVTPLDVFKFVRQGAAPFGWLQPAVEPDDIDAVGPPGEFVGHGHEQNSYVRQKAQLPPRMKHAQTLWGGYDIDAL